MLFNLLLQEPRDEWKAFWKSQLSPSPLVTKIALLVLSTSAEATPSERTFSVAGALSKRRGGGKLKPGTLSSLTMLQRVTRNRLEGKTRLTRAKRLKPMATQPLATQPLAAVRRLHRYQQRRKRWIPPMSSKPDFKPMLGTR